MMNYSDYDSDGYSSNEDADYVPSDDNLSEDDIKECEKEDPLHEDEDVPHPDLIGKKKKMENTRKKRKGVLKVNEQEEDGDGPKEAQQSQEEVEKSSEAHVDAADARQKEKSDKLWASFLSDVGTRPKDCTAGIQEDCSTVKPLPLSRHTEEPKRANVTITKVFDFAGEEIRVNKEVSADSKEAKSFLKSQSIKQEEHDDKEKKQSCRAPTLPGPSSKRPAGMGSILSHIGGKKPKMSTLEKSKMDWDAFKSEEGITEELAIHNRGREGYVERKKFLDRVDHRQFELEKEVRLSNMKQ